MYQEDKTIIYTVVLPFPVSFSVVSVVHSQLQSENTKFLQPSPSSAPDIQPLTSP